MKTLLVTAAFLALAGAHVRANAQTEAESSSVASAITALENEDAQTARRTISAVEGLGGGEQVFWTPAEAIAELSGCDAEALDVLLMGQRHLFLYEWDCGRRISSGGIAANDDPRSVRLVHITEGDRGASTLRQLVSMAPPPPIRIRASSPEAQTEADRRRDEHRRELDMVSLRKSERFAQLLVDGDVDTLAAGVNQYSTLSYGFRHAVLDEVFVEMNGFDSDALRGQVEHIYATLGVPIGYACEIGDRETECEWQFVNPDVALSASINGCCTDRWLIGRIHFGYSTPDARAEFGLVED